VAAFESATLFGFVAFGWYSLNLKFFLFPLTSMENDGAEIRAAIEELTSGFSSVREVIKGLKQKLVLLYPITLEFYSFIFSSQEALDTKDGISLLSVKNHTLLSYLQCLLLVSSRRVLGQSLASRSPPAQPFSARDRSSRGSGAGDLVDSMIESRIVLEKAKTLEAKLRYQIEKLVKVADEPESTPNIIDGM
jgi:U3 small nucleolar ribonucleoprotein protein LCP5